MSKLINISWHSTPISNILQFELESFEMYCESLRALDWQLKGDIVKHFKGVLGKQDYTFTSEVRNYVWESKDTHGLWRVFVSNKKGIYFEVSENASIETAKIAWNDFLSKIGKNQDQLILDFNHKLQSMASRNSS
jgi:hypothetical protein